MKLTKEEKKFLKQYKEILKSIFGKKKEEWEKELRYVRLDLPAEEFKITAVALRRAIFWLDEFLREIKLAEKEKDKEIDKNFI